MRCNAFVLTLISVLAIQVAARVNEAKAKEFSDSQRRTDQAYCPALSSESPPDDSTCWSWVVLKPGEPLGSQKGCDHAPCEEAVCSCDPYCCEQLWDLSCRGYAKNGSQLDNPYNPGCSAGMLCCESDGSYPKPFIGAQPCPSDPSVQGYYNIGDLNNDMTYHENSGEAVDPTYILCPDTTFDMKGRAVTPGLSNTVIKCGQDGSSTNNCVFTGGETHFIFKNDLTLTGVEIQGITMTKSTSTSIAGWSASPSTAKFLDCHWKENSGYSLIDIAHEVITNGRKLHQNSYWNSLHKEPSYQDDNQGLRHMQSVEYLTAMSVIFENCSMINNVEGVGIILGVASTIEIRNCIFTTNESGAITVGVSQEGTLIIDSSSSFMSNRSGFSTVFVDNSSTSDIATGIDAFGNVAINCNTIFIENEGSTCLSAGLGPDCVGQCCEFETGCS